MHITSVTFHTSATISHRHQEVQLYTVDSLLSHKGQQDPDMKNIKQT